MSEGERGKKAESRKQRAVKTQGCRRQGSGFRYCLGGEVSNTAQYFSPELTTL
jgi:hypothetical protein